jgi:hypothetical protein
MATMSPAEIATEKARMMKRLRLVVESLTCINAALGERALATEDEVRAAVAAALAEARNVNARRASWAATDALYVAPNAQPPARSPALEELLRAGGQAA